MIFWALGVLAVLCALFAVRQNVYGALGGPISIAKVLYLNFALAAFFVLPFFLWRSQALPASYRSLWGLLLLSFVLRGLIEAYLMNVTLGWRCIYGISHDAFNLALAQILRFWLPHAAAPFERSAMQLLTLYQAALVVEMFMAWRFSLIADPSTGLYYAAPTEKFRSINRITWAANAWLYSWSGMLLWAARADFLK